MFTPNNGFHIISQVFN